MLHLHTRPRPFHSRGHRRPVVPSRLLGAHPSAVLVHANDRLALRPRTDVIFLSPCANVRRAGWRRWPAARHCQGRYGGPSAPARGFGLRRRSRRAAATERVVGYLRVGESRGAEVPGEHGAARRGSCLHRQPLIFFFAPVKVPGTQKYPGYVAYVAHVASGNYAFIQCTVFVCFLEYFSIDKIARQLGYRYRYG